MKPINIDASPIPIQGPGAESVGRPFQYTPLDFTIPFRAQQMAMQQQSDLANLAMRQKELEMREKTLEYQMTSDARKEYLAMMDNVFGAIQSGGVGGGGRTAQGGVPADDFGIFNQSQAAMDWQAMQSEIAMSVLDSLPHNFNTPQDYRGATDILAKKTQELYKQQMQMRRDNPHLIQMQELNRKHNLWMEQQKKADEKNVLRHSGNLQLISDKIAEINQLDSKDPLIQEKLQELDNLYTNKSSVVNASSFNEYIKDAGDNYAKGRVKSKITTIDGYEVLVDEKFQEDPDVRATVLAVNAITNSDFREVFKAKGWTSDNDLYNIDRILSLTRPGPNGEEPQYTVEEAIQIIDQDGLLGNVKNVISSSLVVNDPGVGVEGEGDQTIRQFIDKSKGGKGGAGGGAYSSKDWADMGTKMFESKQSNGRIMWNYLGDEVAKGNITQQEAITLAQQYQIEWDNYNEYKAQYEATGNLEDKEAMDAPQAPPTPKVYYDGEMSARKEAEESAKIESEINQKEEIKKIVKSPTSEDPTTSLDEKVNNAGSDLDDEKIILPGSEEAGTQDKTSAQIYNDNIANYGGEGVSVYNYILENGYSYDTLDGFDGMEFTTSDVEFWKNNNVNPFDVKYTTSDGVRGGLYNFGEEDLVNMIGSFSNSLFTGSGDPKAESSALQTRISNMFEKTDDGYILKKEYAEGKDQNQIYTDMQSIMAEMTDYDSAMMIAHQKKYFTDKYVKPNKEKYDNVISNNEVRYLNPETGYPTKISSDVKGFDYLMTSVVSDKYSREWDKLDVSDRQFSDASDVIVEMTNHRLNTGSKYVIGDVGANLYMRKIDGATLQEFYDKKNVNATVLHDAMASMLGGYELSKEAKKAGITEAEILSLSTSVSPEDLKLIGSEVNNSVKSWRKKVLSEGQKAFNIYSGAERNQNDKVKISSDELNRTGEEPIDMQQDTGFTSPPIDIEEPELTNEEYESYVETTKPRAEGKVTIDNFDSFDEAVDFSSSFLAEREGGIYTEGYVPQYTKTVPEEGKYKGKPIASSGVTIGAGIDLGQQSEDGDSLREMGVSDTLIEKLKPFLGKKKAEAQKALKDYYDKNGKRFSISKDEAIELTKGAFKVYEKQAKNVIGSDVYNSLPDGLKTAAVSYTYQMGAGNFKTDFGDLYKKKDYTGIKNKLLNLSKTTEYTERRKKEAELINTQS